MHYLQTNSDKCGIRTHFLKRGKNFYKRYLLMKWLGKLFPYGNFQINLCSASRLVTIQKKKQKGDENHIIKVNWIISSKASNPHATKSNTSYIRDNNQISTIQIKIKQFQVTMLTSQLNYPSPFYRAIRTDSASKLYRSLSELTVTSKCNF